MTVSLINGKPASFKDHVINACEQLVNFKDRIYTYFPPEQTADGIYFNLELDLKNPLRPSLVGQIIRVIACATLILPLIAHAIKTYYRKNHDDLKKVLPYVQFIESQRLPNTDRNITGIKGYDANAHSLNFTAYILAVEAFLCKQPALQVHTLLNYKPDVGNDMFKLDRELLVVLFKKYSTTSEILESGISATLDAAYEAHGSTFLDYLLWELIQTNNLSLPIFNVIYFKPGTNEDRTRIFIPCPIEIAQSFLAFLYEDSTGVASTLNDSLKRHFFNNLLNKNVINTLTPGNVEKALSVLISIKYLQKSSSDLAKDFLDIVRSRHVRVGFNSSVNPLYREDLIEPLKNLSKADLMQRLSALNLSAP